MQKNSEEPIRILVVDDEESIVEFLRMGLMSEGYEVATAYDGIQAIILARELKPQLVILDLMLPGVNGYEVCTQIKSSMKTAVIMLTAKDEVEDCVNGLNIGADDYMTKPFSYKELSARIKARLRDACPDKLSNRRFGVFELDEDAHEIYFYKRLLELTSTEYNVLKYLLINNGIVLSKGKILDAVWGYDFEGDENIVEVYIGYLRQKLGTKGHQTILTIRGAGYKAVVYEQV